MATPSYTQVDPSTHNWTIGTSDAWTDYDLFTNQGVPKGAVAEILIAKPNNYAVVGGIRTDGSALNRYIQLRPAGNAGGASFIRMFVTCHATTGLVECYAEDKNLFKYYLVSYIEGVTFTELFDAFFPSASGSWVDKTLATAAPSKVNHFLIRNDEASTSNYGGVRANGSALERRISLANGAAQTYVTDMLAKADGSSIVEVYGEDKDCVLFCVLGFFETDLDFTELWQTIAAGSTGWQDYDLTAYLDQDGRLCNVLMMHDNNGAEVTLGARDGDDTTSDRKLMTLITPLAGAYAGLGGITVQSNSSGVVKLYTDDAANELITLTGYFNIGGAPVAPAYVLKMGRQRVWDRRSRVYHSMSLRGG